MKTFASDNCSGVHPEILKAMIDANHGHTIAYGADPYTEKVIQKFQKLFGQDIEVFFVMNGTAANVLGIKQVTQSFHSIICSETSHLNEDECGAPERFTGCKLISLPSKNGKITVKQIQPYLINFGVEHRAQPKVISITQSTEYGTVYTIDEIRSIANLAHQHELLLHMDGARLANAAVFLNRSLKEITVDAGVDVLSLGGTKNGMLFGEAIVFFNPTLAANFKYIRKQGLHLLSKMRFISVQFDALLTNELWKHNANQANQMAQMLANALKQFPSIQITQPVEANAVFAILPVELIPKLQQHYFFYVWNEQKAEVRFMATFDTEEQDIHNLVATISECI